MVGKQSVPFSRPNTFPTMFWGLPVYHFPRFGFAFSTDRHYNDGRDRRPYGYRGKTRGSQRRLAL
jgi:hypothetical protein